MMAPAERRKLARGATTVVFAALVATPWIITHAGGHLLGKAAADARRYGFHLTESAHAAGVDFVHVPPRLDPKLRNIAPYVAMFGASVALVDVNGDGLLDIYVTQSGTGLMNRLYRNNGDGTFTDVAPEAGLADLNEPGEGVSMGSVWADYDNDGDPDLFLYRWGKTALFRNDGDFHFTDVTAEAGLGNWMNANSATWFDYNNDGLLDLYVAGYFPAKFDLQHLSTTRILANSFEYATNGGRNHLYRNLGNGKFEDVTDQTNADCRRWTLAVGAADLDGDGRQDLFIANDYGQDVILHNRGGTHFDHLEPGGAMEKPKSGMNVAFGDIDDDGALDVFVTNISKSGYLSQGNNLWQDAAGHSVNIAVPAGVASTGWAWGAQFGDLNNDGWLDLFVANGFLSADAHQDYWYDMAKMAQGTGALFEDTRNWPPIGRQSLSGYERSAVFLNDHAGGFYDVAQAVGVEDTYDGRAVALGDLFNDGALDVVVANERGPLLIYRNKVDPRRSWIGFNLVGTRSNRDALGATVTMYWDNHRQTAVVTSGCGFASQNDRRVHFGLGTNPVVHKVVIRWPSGTVQTITAPATDRYHRVVEPSGVTAAR